MRCRQIAFLIAGLTLAACADQTESRPVTINDQSDATRIETDQSSGAIRFILNGREQARIDADGMHVRENISANNQVLAAPYQFGAPANGVK